jgi:CheY-like chemotaxis protein
MTRLEGLRVLELFAENVFDAVLCDLGLPDVPGELVIRQLVARSTLPIAVAAVTGHEEPHLTRARVAGAQAVFRKPVEWERIVAFLRLLKTPRTEPTHLAA